MPTPYTEASYARALREMRDWNRTIARGADRRLMEAYSEAWLRLTSTNIPHRQALALEVSAAMDGFHELVNATTGAGTNATIARVLRTHDEALRRIYDYNGATDTGLSVNFGRLAPGIAQYMSAMRGAESFRSLTALYTGQARRTIDGLINAGLVRGLSAGEMARDIAQIMLAEHPELTMTMPGRSTLHRARIADLDLVGRYGVDPRRLREARMLLYNSRRVAVSEINNAWRASNQGAMMASPVVEAARWQTSGRHPKEDECDVLASADMYDYGPGMYPPDRWPIAPHPFCGCTQAGPMRFRDPSTWGQPKPLSSPGNWDGMTSRIPSGWSEARRARALRTLERSAWVSPPPSLVEAVRAATRPPRAARLTSTPVDLAAQALAADAAALLRITDTVGDDFRDEVNGAFAAFTPGTRRRLRENGSTIQAGHHITELDPSLRGVKPRGWTSGSTWDDAEGLYNNATRTAMVTEYVYTLTHVAGQRRRVRAFVRSSRATGVLRHEVGHALDRLPGGGFVSRSPEFLEAYRLDRQGIAGMESSAKSALSYYLQKGSAGPSEAFAEGFSRAFGGQGSGWQSRELWARAFPRVNAYIEAFINGLPS